VGGEAGGDLQLAVAAVAMPSYFGFGIADGDLRARTASRNAGQVIGAHIAKTIASTVSAAAIGRSAWW
jgi:hypothetical protein